MKIITFSVSVVTIVMLAVILVACEVSPGQDTYQQISVEQMIVCIPDSWESAVEEMKNVILLPDSEDLTVDAYCSKSKDAYLVLMVLDMRSQFESEGESWLGWTALETAGLNKEQFAWLSLPSNISTADDLNKELDHQLIVHGSEVQEYEFSYRSENRQKHAAVLSIFGANRFGQLIMLADEAKWSKFEGTWDKIRDSSQYVVVFSNLNLDIAIREVINKPEGSIYTSDLIDLNSLSVPRSNITNLTGLGYCSNMVELDLYHNNISDVSPLASLTNLTELSLGENEISDISPLASLTNLTELQLFGNEISDISPLVSLTNLNVLNLGGNIISDVSPLVYLTELTWLHLWQNKISDVLPLTSLTNLTEIHLSGNQISDVSPLASLPNLTRLVIGGNPLSDTSINTYIPQLIEKGLEVSY